MERADVQQEAALETAAPPTVERQPGQQRSQAPSYINPRDPRLHLSDPQPRTLSPEPLHPGSAAADASDSGSPASAKSEQGQAESSDRQASPAQPAGSEGQQGAEERSQRRCSHCSSPHSNDQWRRHPTTGAWLCHACGCYAKRNSGSLPSAAVLQRREQQRQVLAASKLRHVPLNQRRCLQRGASSPGAGCHWHRHPATKEELLCHKCYQRALYQLKRRREHEAASSNDGDEEASEEGEEAQPPSQAPAVTQQQAAPVRPLMPDPPVQQGSSAIAIASYVADTRQQQQLRGLSQQQQQQPQAVSPDATWEPVPEQPALLPAHMPPAQASTGLLVLEAAQQAAAAAAGLTEGLAGTFAALLPMAPEQDECLRLMLKGRQYSGAAGLMRGSAARARHPGSRAPSGLARAACVPV